MAVVRSGLSLGSNMPSRPWMQLKPWQIAHSQPKEVKQLRGELAQHPDDVAVDALASLMRAKLAKQRDKGYGGWNTEECTQQRLSDMLRAHVEKGRPGGRGELLRIPVCARRGYSSTSVQTAEVRSPNGPHDDAALRRRCGCTGLLSRNSGWHYACYGSPGSARSRWHQSCRTCRRLTSWLD